MGKRDRTAAAVDPDAPELSPTSCRSRPQQAKRRGASPQETVNASAAQGSITGRTAGTRYPDAPTATAPAQREAGNADAEGDVQMTDDATREKAERKAARKAAKAADKAQKKATPEEGADNAAGDAAGAHVEPVQDEAAAVADAPPKKKQKKNAPETAENRPSHPEGGQADAANVEGNANAQDRPAPSAPQLHPSLAGLIPAPTRAHDSQASNAQAGPSQQQHHQHQAGAPGGMHRDIPVDPVLLGLPNPPAHFATSSVRGPTASTSGSGAGNGKGRSGGATAFAPGDPSLAYGPSTSAGEGDQPRAGAAAPDDTRQRSTSQAGPSRSGSAAPRQSGATPAPDTASGSYIPNHRRSKSGSQKPIGAEGVEANELDFYEQLRTKWLPTKDLKVLAEQYGATWKSGKFSVTEDNTLRAALDSYRVQHNMSIGDLRALLLKKRDVRRPLAHGQAQNEIWEHLARALGDRPLLSIYNHVKVLISGDPVEPPAKAEGDAAAASASATDANAVASGSGSGADNGQDAGPAPLTSSGVLGLGDGNRKGRWTKEEDLTLKRAFEELGSAWSRIGELLGRNGTACRDRWTKQLNNGLALGVVPVDYKQDGVDAPKKMKEGKWSEDEVEELKRLYQQHPAQWKAISRGFGGTRTSTQCRTKWNDYVARREAVQKAKQAGDAQQIAAGDKDVATKDEWRWQPTDASRLVHTVAALGVSDQSEIEWKAIDDPRLAIHGPKNLRDRFRHLVKTAKREVQNERPRTPEGAAQEVSFQDAFEKLLKQYPTPDHDPTHTVTDKEKAEQRSKRRAERKAAKRAERERAQIAESAAREVANLAASSSAVAGGSGAGGMIGAEGGIGGPPASSNFAGNFGMQAEHARGFPGHEQLGGIGKTSNLSQAYVDDSGESGDDRGDIRVDSMGRRI